MTTDFSNSTDVIDSRDVIERIGELEGELDVFCDENEIPDSERGNTNNEKWMDWEDSSEGQELKVLLALQSEAEGSPDWQYGEQLIRDSYFEEYAQELAEDCGMVERDVKWPYTCIDWEKAARELQYDYSIVNFDGVDYWIRS